MNSFRTLEPELQSDEEMVARAIKGDVDAFGDLYQRHLPSIYRYLYYRLGEVLEAEDLTENVFLKAWQGLKSFKKGKGSFRTWLYRVAHNTLIDHYRTMKQESPLQPIEELEAPSPRPEEQVIAKERSQGLARAIARLKPEFQEILTLRFINGMSHMEAGQVMGRSSGAVRVLQHRALKALGEILEGSGEDRG
ncbi:MAG: RNA polymerase sigma factor [Anaerolineales bacterium]|jgi:RNA polymerase sigma-70 factor (ECF subfamily)